MALSDKLLGARFSVIRDFLDQVQMPDGFDLAGFGNQANFLHSYTGARRALKPFIVGLIPPDVPVNFFPIQRDQQSVMALEGGTATAAANNAEKTPKGPEQTAVSGQSNVDNLTPAFYQKLVQVAANINATPEGLLAVLYSESGLNPAATNPLGAKGLQQMIKSSSRLCGITPQQWETYEQWTAEEQLTTVETMYKNIGRGRDLRNPASLYLLNAGQSPNAGNPGRVVFAGGSIEYQHNRFFDRDNSGDITVQDFILRIEEVTRDPEYQKAKSALQAAQDQASQASPTGVADAAAADPEQGAVMAYGNVTDPNDPLRDNLGRNISVDPDRIEVAAKQTEDLRRQIEVLKATPPLMMLVNPSSFERNYENSVDSSVKARRGNVVHSWIERPMSISCSGTTAAQYVVGPDGSGGLTGTLRTHSISYFNLLSLIAIYKTNGVIYNGVAAERGIPVVAFSIFIYYDHHVYIGSFDDFSVNDGADKPHNLGYSFKFTSRYDMDAGNPGFDRILGSGGTT